MALAVDLCMNTSALAPARVPLEPGVVSASAL